jgi:hypothetical protein
MEKISFDPLKKIKEYLKYVKNYLPICTDKLKEENSEIYNIVQ